MNANDTLHFDTVRIGRFVETAVYAGLAVVLIGQIFFHQGPVTLKDAAQVMLGAVFGLLACCSCGPLCTLLSRWEHRRAPSQSRPGDVLPFTRHVPQENSSLDSAPRHAA